MTGSLALLIGLPVLPLSPLLGQQQIAVEVKVVNVFATLRERHGQIVSKLGKDDFVLEEDGKPQTIAYFSKETDLPLTLGLLVDTSLSQRRILDHGPVSELMAADGGDAEEVIAQFAKAGIDYDKLAADLQREAAESFVKDWNEMLASIASKSAAFKAAG